MRIRKPSFFLFRNLWKRLLQSGVLRFLFFIERRPKHRVMESLSITFLASLSIGCYLAGLAGFIVWERYTFLGFVVYYVGVLLVLLESLHCLLDR